MLTLRYRADSLMAMGNFDETAKELPRSPKVENMISCRRSPYLTWLLWNSLIRSNSESWNNFCEKKYCFCWKPPLILNISGKSKNVITFDSEWFKSWSFEGWKIRVYIFYHKIFKNTVMRKLLVKYFSKHRIFFPELGFLDEKTVLRHLPSNFFKKKTF